jgi:hypothetical protein
VFDTFLRARHGLPENGVPLRKLPIYLVRSRTDLQITWNGDEYQSRETMQRAVPIDSLGFTQGGGRPGLGPGLRAAIWFIDP